MCDVNEDSEVTQKSHKIKRFLGPHPPESRRPGDVNRVTERPWPGRATTMPSKSYSCCSNLV